MTKLGKKEFKKLIKEIFEENNIDFSSTKFLKLIEKGEKEILKLKKKVLLDKNKIQDLLCIIEKADEDDYDDGWSVEEIITEEVDCYINEKESLYDLFRQENYPDEGVARIFYIKYDNKFYEVEVHCSAEWVGDWSVRANVPGSTDVKSVKEIKCEVLTENTIKLIR